MKREEKNTQSRRRILEAALVEFGEKGYESASLNEICAANNISKGIIYHYFKDKDELYLFCLEDCFGALTAYMEKAVAGLSGSLEQSLCAYFDARLRFFAENPRQLGLFLNVLLNPPAHLTQKIAAARGSFDSLSITVLTGLLEKSRLRDGFSVAAVVEDFRIYMDYYNARFRSAASGAPRPAQALAEHEAGCHRQLAILLHGVLHD